jgi:hypothetical protein
MESPSVMPPEQELQLSKSLCELHLQDFRGKNTRATLIFYLDKFLLNPANLFPWLLSR